MIKSTEWLELQTLADVAKAQVAGWDIEVTEDGVYWHKWIGESWKSGWIYRGRPAQPKKIDVISECWRDPQNGALIWRRPNQTPFGLWKRFPTCDACGEAEE